MHMQCEGAKHVLALDNKSFFQLRATYDIEYTVGTRTRDLTQGKVATKPTTVDNPPPTPAWRDLRHLYSSRPYLTR